MDKGSRLDHFKAENGLWALRNLREIVMGESWTGDAEHFFYIAESTLKSLAREILKKNQEGRE